MPKKPRPTRPDVIANQVFLAIPWRGVRPRYEHCADYLRSRSPLSFVIVGRADSQNADDLPRIVSTKKIRWLKKFDTGGGEPTEISVGEDEAPTDRRPLPKLGCNVELTRVEVGGEDIWWTLGFEAFGELAAVERSLRSTLSLMAARRPPSLASGELLNYPAWLSKRIRQQQSSPLP